MQIHYIYSECSIIWKYKKKSNQYQNCKVKRAENNNMDWILRVLMTFYSQKIISKYLPFLHAILYSANSKEKTVFTSSIT